MTQKRLNAFLAMALDAATSDAERLLALNKLAQDFPELADKAKRGDITLDGSSQSQRTVTRTVEVPPPDYKALQRMADELLTLKITALKNGIADYGNRFVRVMEVAGHLKATGKTPEEFGITVNDLLGWQEQESRTTAMAKKGYEALKKAIGVGN